VPAKKATRVVISAAVVFSAMFLLFYLSVSSQSQYFKNVDEVTTSPAQWYGKPMQVHGFVVADSISHRGPLDIWFQVQSEGKTLGAFYDGIVPDTFQDGAEVVLRGQLQSDGFHVVKNGVMAKCPSKYDEDKLTSKGVSRPK
jgi:cytochrome c-type biogenesis protein CcmE